MTTNDLSIYVHIPFCGKKCNYCAFYSLPACDESCKQEYTEALLRQINSIKTSRSVSSVYFGGGTPPELGAGRLSATLAAIMDSFSLTRDCEITVEINPGGITRNELKLLRYAGFNRISLGMQSSVDKELAVLGRAYTSAEYGETLNAVLQTGFSNISTDIIFGIPHQTKETLKESLMTAIKAELPHISVYSLSIEEGTPFFGMKDSLNLPDEESEEEMHLLICSLLKKHNYEHYEISSFAKKGWESRHNLHYWSCGEYIGFGAAAHSYYNGKRFSNASDAIKYTELADVNYYSPTDYGEQPLLTYEDLRTERIMLGLRTSKGIIADKNMLDRSKVYIKNGFAQLDGDILSLTEKGFRVSNSIIAELLL